MKLSRKTHYCLRILVYMAKNNYSPDELTQGKLIAEEHGLTMPYLEQLIAPLKKGGLVETVRGCNGGYMLTRPPSEITLLEVIEAMECLSLRTNEIKIFLCT